VSDKKFIVNVFGKEGCAKCSMLNRRIDKLLTEEKYSCFVKRYNDVLTEDGMVKFCLAQCLNPNRIPAMVISTVGADGKEHYMDNDDHSPSDVYKRSKLYQYLGVQTDYSAEGNGIIPPEMIEAVLKEALALAGCAAE